MRNHDMKTKHSSSKEDQKPLVGRQEYIGRASVVRHSEKLLCMLLI